MHVCEIKERLTNGTLFYMTLDELHNTRMRFCREIACYKRIKVRFKIPIVHCIL